MLTDDELELLRGRTSNPDTLKALAELDRKRDWQAKVAPFVDDARVWSIVAAVVETGLAMLESGGVNQFFIKEDVMGVRPRYFEVSAKERRRKFFATGKYEPCYRIGAVVPAHSSTYRYHYPVTGGVIISPNGWELAQPLVQKALDGLGVRFESHPHSGLTCSLGTFAWERVWNINGVDLPEFDSLLGDFPYMTYRNYCDLPMTRRLVDVAGWATSRIGAPIRPDEHMKRYSEIGDAIRAAAPDVAKRWMQR